MKDLLNIDALGFDDKMGTKDAQLKASSCQTNILRDSSMSNFSHNSSFDFRIL